MRMLVQMFRAFVWWHDKVLREHYSESEVHYLETACWLCTFLDRFRFPTNRSISNWRAKKKAAKRNRFLFVPLLHLHPQHMVIVLWSWIQGIFRGRPTGRWVAFSLAKVDFWSPPCKNHQYRAVWYGCNILKRAGGLMEFKNVHPSTNTCCRTAVRQYKITDVQQNVEKMFLLWNYTVHITQCMVLNT